MSELREVKLTLNEHEAEQLVSLINVGVYERSGSLHNSLAYKLVVAMGAESVGFCTEVQDRAELYEATNGEQ